MTDIEETIENFLSFIFIKGQQLECLIRDAYTRWMQIFLFNKERGI